MKIEHEGKETESEEWLEPASTVSQEPYISCSYCLESFPNRLYLVLHSEIHHPNQDIEGIQTSEVQCDESWIDPTKENSSTDHPTDAKTHLEEDEVNTLCDTDECLQCKVCRRTFKARHLLKRHLRRSTCKDEFCIPMQVGEFPFYCDICGHGK